MSADTSPPDNSDTLQEEIKMLKQQLSDLNSLNPAVQQRATAGTSSVVSDLRTLKKMFDKHLNFVEKWKNQPKEVKTLALEESLMDFALRAFEEFKEAYHEYVPDVEKALQPPPSKKKSSDEPSKKKKRSHDDDEPPPPLKKHSASKKKRNAKNDAEDQQSVPKRRGVKPPA